MSEYAGKTVGANGWLSHVNHHPIVANKTKATNALLDNKQGAKISTYMTNNCYQ
jgi:hypothetical protein